MSETNHVIVIGAGAAGMLAAIAAAREGAAVELWEQNEKPGKKLFITGKGRCNVTNACDMEELLGSVVSNSKFLYSSFYGFTNQDMMDLLEQAGLRLKVERGNRVFPQSDKSSDVISALSALLRQAGVRVCLNQKAEGLAVEEGVCKGVRCGGRIQTADRVIVATGGLSYPATGSTGDGYRFAKEAGHTVTELFPALVPLEVREAYAGRMQGLALKNVRFTVKDGKKVLYDEFGELLFTHFGISGPLVLTASSKIAKRLKKKELQGYIDVKAALSEEQLDARILRDFEENRNRQFKNSIGGLFPAKMEPVMLELSGIPPEKKVNEITREERRHFVSLIKALPLTITGLRDFKEAIITQGGVKTGEISPGSMESKKVKGLYFIGEVLDLDAVTGGFNLQIAWSTAFAAASSINESI